MMWFDYTTTAGLLCHYTDRNGIEKQYQVNYIQPIQAVKNVASIINANDITEVTCAGIAYTLVQSIQQELMSSYHNNRVKFVEA